MNTRRQFLIAAPLGVLGVSAACSGQQSPDKPPSPAPAATTPGAPPTFGTGPTSGPPVTSATFAEAEKLAQVSMTEAERSLAAASWRRSMAPLLERRVGPRKVALDAQVQPATGWNPSVVAWPPSPALRRLLATCSCAQTMTGRRCPASDTDIAYAPVTRLSRWIERRQLTSERLTNIYLSRIERFDSKLRSVITLTKDACHRPGEAGRRRDRRGPIPRAAPRHPVRRQGSAGHGRHRHDLRRRAIQGSRARRRLRGRQALDRRRRRPHRQVEPGSAGTQRHLVRRPDDESVADRRRRLGVERGARRGDGGGARRLLDRQRNRRQHRVAIDALRRHRLASDIRTRAADWRHDAVLVARQAWSDDAQRRGCDAGPPGDLRRRTRATRAASRATSSSMRTDR